jgi:DNA-binding NtrC family response regulator
MATSQSNQQASGASGISPSPTIVYVAGDSDESKFHAAALRSAGYKLQTARTAEEALWKLGQGTSDVVIIGHELSLAERQRTEEGIRKLRPRPRVVLLYDARIAQTEQADAVLNVNSEPQHLVQTIRYLLTGSD